MGRQFTGTDRIACGTGVLSQLTPFVVTGWFNQRSALGGGLLLKKSDTSGFGKRFSENGSNDLRFRVYKGGGSTNAETTTVSNVLTAGGTPGGWQFVVASYDNTSPGPKIYLAQPGGGVAECSYASQTNGSGSEDEASGGGDLELGLTLDGRLHDMRIFNRVLTINEMDAVKMGRVVAGCVWWMPLDGGSSPEPELVGGKHGTVTGATYLDSPPGWQGRMKRAARIVSGPAIVAASGPPKNSLALMGCGV